jgi:hypothetical protein
VSVFRFSRIEEPGDLPPAESATIDVALLDMNLGWPNMGHDLIVGAVRNLAGELAPRLEPAGLAIRVLSFEVRQRHRIPEPPGERFLLYLGTGGPGHPDPRLNDGRPGGAEIVREDPAWEAPLFSLYGRILEREDAALLAVCHSFGLLCRWAHVARPVPRGSKKGGGSRGVRDNILSDEAVSDPWFSRFSAELPDHRRFRVIESRHFDLVPNGSFPAGAVPLSYEPDDSDGPRALTMLEMGRRANDPVPRILAVNHHPEVIGAENQRRVLKEKYARGEVPESWYRDRLRLLSEYYADRSDEDRLRLTSLYTLLLPLRHHLGRLVDRRLADLA